jgi:hypothetical protein
MASQCTLCGFVSSEKTGIRKTLSEKRDRDLEYKKKCARSFQPRWKDGRDWLSSLQKVCTYRIGEKQFISGRV